MYVTAEIGNVNKLYLVKIEMASTDSTVLGDKASAPNSSVDTDISISEIYDFVKNHDKGFEKGSNRHVYFNPKPVNSLLLDSEVHAPHSNNAKNDLICYDHKLYALGKSTDGSIELYKITVEERYQDPYNTNEKKPQSEIHRKSSRCPG